MSVRIIGIGDIHEHQSPRNADRLRAVDQIIHEGLQVERLGAWVVAGDLFHAKSTVEGRNALDERIQRMAAVAPVIVVRGNHDEVGDLDGFGRLKAGWPIYVFERPHVAVVRLATGQMAGVFAFPYPTRAGLVSAGIAPADVVDTAAGLLDPIFMLAAEQLQHARDAGYLTFMVGHANIVGSISSSGQPQWGREIDVSAGHLERLGPILKLFGHIHKPQEISGAIYLGSVCRLDFGETEEKRYVVAELEADSSYAYASRHLAVAPMFHVEGLLTRDGFRLAEGSDGEIERRYHAGDWAGCDVRVRYCYQASEASVISAGFVAKHFVDALRLKLESVVIADREVRSPEVAAARTLPEKLAAYRLEPQLASSVLDKVTALEQQDRQQVLAGVAAALAQIEAREEVLVAA